MANQSTAENAAATDPQFQKDRELLAEARKKGFWATLRAYTKLSGPGWLQSAITLGGGSLSSSLYLGVLGGFALLWLQPVAMVIGIIMLSAIGYVTLSTGERPFRAINKHVNPVLGWGWLLATLLANCVWSMPQFSLACGAFRQNLMPGVFGTMTANAANGWIAGTIAVLCAIIVYFYDSGAKGVKFFDILLKAMVAVIVVSFFGVVVYMTAKGGLDWRKVGGGLIPDLRMLWTPASSFDSALAAVGKFKSFWTDMIVSEQQDVLVAAAATAVGINMTFLLPYSMLRKGWNRDFRGLAVFDLSTGLFVPFVLATGCVVIAAAAQFHTKPAIPFPADDAAAAIAQAGPGSPGAEQKTQNLQSIIAKAYEECLTDQAKESFPNQAAQAVAAAMAKPGFADLPPAARQAEIHSVLQTESHGKLLDLDPKLVDGYVGLALQRMGEEAGAAKAKELKESLKAPKKALADAKKAQDGKQVQAAAKRLVQAEMNLVAPLPLADRKMAAMLVYRDNIDLAQSLSPLTGNVVAHYVFGVGVVGMAVSSIIILMLINGFCICEMVDKPSKGWLYRFGCLIPAVGVLGPFIWSGAAPYLAVPTSVSQFIVIPIAYTTFALLVNQRKLLGDNMPKGLGRWVWNLFMLVGVLAVAIGSVYMAWKSTKGLPGFWGGGWVGLGGVAAFIAAVIVVHFIRKARGKEAML